MARGTVYTLNSFLAASKAAPMRALILADTANESHVVRDYVDGIAAAFDGVVIRNPREPSIDTCPALSDFDAVVIHYSICIRYNTYLPPHFRDPISKFQGLKILVLQDEYRWINITNSAAISLGIDIVVSSLEPHNARIVYAELLDSGASICSALPGYIPNRLLGVERPPIARRPLDVIYRSREIDYWIGSFCREKLLIAEGFLARVQGKNLRLDIDCTENGRIYDADWIKFLQSSKCMLGCEGGANLFDFDMSVEHHSRLYQERNPNANFEEVFDNVLRPFDGNVEHKTITPRHFEAAALGTVQILFPGRYREIIEPDKHYIPLSKDFSNLADVLEKIEDAEFLQRLADHCYQDIALNPNFGFPMFSRKLAALCAMFRKPSPAPGAQPLNAPTQPGDIETPAQYWSGYHVDSPDEGFRSVEDSLSHLHWRNSCYFNYVESMPVDRASEKVIVDFGCGPGNDLLGFGHFSKPKRLIGLDVSPNSLLLAQKRLRLHEIEVELHCLPPQWERLPLDDASIDIVHSSGVLHHLRDPKLALNEFARILKPGGFAQIMVYNYDSLWVHLYTAYEIQISQGKWSDASLREAFAHTTDGEDCPISRCYTVDEFSRLAHSCGFLCEHTGNSISTTEMKLLPVRYAAIEDQRLNGESRDFLCSLTFDNRQIPMYQNQIAGINAAFRLTPRSH